MLRLAFAAALAAALWPAAAAAQVWGEIAGRVTAAGSGEPIPGATVLVEGTNFGSAADVEGEFRFRIPEGAYPIRVSAVGFDPARDSVRVRRGRPTRLDVALREADLDIGTAVVTGDRAGLGAGVSQISPADVRAMPTPVADALRAVKVQLGVTSNNELSNAYSVRGGSTNENQFFIDGFEIYRPIRTRQGEQEGLGLVNGDLAERLTLYAGGFPVRYGGKLSSVLDVAYARPDGPVRGTAYGSTLDAGAAVHGELGPVGVAVAARNARPQSFFGTQELKGDYDPDFRDVQGVADWDLGAGHRLRAVGLAARHRFRFAPRQRRTTFGIFPNFVRTVAYEYDGEESDGYDVRFGGLRLETPLGRRLGGTLRAEHTLAAFDTEEFERLDVATQAQLFVLRQDAEVPTQFDAFRQGQIGQRDVADNVVGVQTITAGGRYRLARGRGASELGWHVRRLAFRDDILEFTQISGVSDDTGDPISQTVDSLATSFRRATSQVAVWGEQAYSVIPERLVVTGGVRLDQYELTDELTVSPRLSGVWKAGERTTLLGSLGRYYQAPTYRELRGEPEPGATGITLNRDLRSQRADVAVVGLEHLFARTRLSVRAEAYYKRLADLVSYTVENVRVLYAGDNDSEGYAYGLDLQVRGELIPGLESWVSYGLLKTEERFVGAFANERNGGGAYIPRPTDRRHNLAVFVQDHIPGDDSWTLHLRALYGSRLPTTPPAVSGTVNAVTVFEPGDRHAIRLPSYFRFDVGATKTLVVGKSFGGQPLELLATAEVLNVFDQANTIAFSYVQETSSGRQIFQAVPTRLTPRAFNVRLRLDF